MPQAKRLDRAFFDRDTVRVARALLGQRLVRVMADGTRLAGLILETEAYLGPYDLAAHTAGYRRTQRTEPMWMAGGTAYVYLTYGMHHLINIASAGEGVPQAVLIRAVEPVEGQEMMRRYRPIAKRDLELGNGPAKLTQAMAIDGDLNREDLTVSSSLFVEQARSRALPGSRIAVTRRIGIDYAGVWTAAPLRFHIADHPGVSRPPKRLAPPTAGLPVAEV
ncbi:MAG: DNA-3-methyladenine glycosylase [Planctomycetota bacterium]